ncbi:MAG: Zn-dependent oligopeptidase [Armatimonadetes bacterium]|nr:Zn-dependent oligopeptidase [Armatimonadota bacterium]
MRIFLIFLFLLAALPAGAQTVDLVPPEVRWNYTPTEIEALTKDTLKEAQARVDAIASRPAGQRTFANTVLAYESVRDFISEKLDPPMFLRDASADLEVQEAASKAADSVSAFAAQNEARADLYEALQSAGASDPPKDAVEARLLEETLRDLRRSGAALPAAQRTEVAALKTRLSLDENAFGQNIARANDTVSFTAVELAGVSPDVLKSLKRDAQGKYLITVLASSSYYPVVDNAKNPNTRKNVWLARNRTAGTVNVPLLEKAIGLRTKIANLLGFPNHAAYVLEAKMAKSPTRVRDFLGNLERKLAPRVLSEENVLLALKRRDDPKATRLEPWDIRYYMDQVKRRDYSVDAEALRPWFPVDHVIKTVFDIYQKALSVKFTELPQANAWAPDVRLFQINDANDGHLIGHFYLDLYPRPNKYKHFAAAGVVGGRRRADGSYVKTVSVVLGNFPPAAPGRPSLLLHADVETFFHEFGHVMHQTLTTARYLSMSGTNVRDDFVEAPSQMLENWAWNPGILRVLSHNYKTGKPLSSVQIARLIKSRHANEAITYATQLLYANVDLDYHTSATIPNTTSVWRAAAKRLLHYDLPAESCPQATFGHLMGGYDAGYYGYLWSEVYAQDMFTVFEHVGLDSPMAGNWYRHWILEPGGTLEPDVLLYNFLGRKPSYEAFYRSIGIK